MLLVVSSPPDTLLIVSQLLLPVKEVWSAQFLPGNLKLRIPLTHLDLSHPHPITIGLPINTARHLPSLETQTRSSARQCSWKKEKWEWRDWERSLKGQKGEWKESAKGQRTREKLVSHAQASPHSVVYLPSKSFQFCPSGWIAGSSWQKLLSTVTLHDT